MTRSTSAMEGAILGGKYKLLSKIGSGGMGAVYAAEHVVTRGRLAVKVILDSRPKNRELLGRFELEARAAATIQSRHIVRVFDVGVDEDTGAPYMVMERLEGTDLQHVLRKESMLHEDVVKSVGLQVCLGLGAAHRAGFVHRDVKPANLFLAREETGELCVKVLDFGVAKLRVDDLGESAEESLTKTGMMVGSPQFMSPEQARGVRNLDARSDLWSLGVSLYRMLSGRLPFDRETLGDTILAICSTRAPSLSEVAPWVSRDLAEVIGKSLARKAADRFQSADEFADALRALQRETRSLRPERVRAPSQAEIESVVQTNALARAVITPAEATAVGTETQSTHASEVTPDAEPTLPRRRRPWFVAGIVLAFATVFGAAALGFSLRPSTPVTSTAFAQDPGKTSAIPAPSAIVPVSPPTTTAAKTPEPEPLVAPHDATAPKTAVATSGTAPTTKRIVVPVTARPAPSSPPPAKRPPPSLVKPVDDFD
ncbi:MAG: protein kinase [Polyangiaceae bacterium]